MERTIDEIAKKIKDIANRRERLANTLHEIDGVFTPQLKLPINDFKLDKIKICGVDGGFLRNAYHGAGIILRRAVAVCFTYQNNKLVKTDYHPDRRPIPDPIVVGPEFSESDFNTLANLKRVEIELKTAIEAIQKFRPDVMLLDGSVVLYPSNMPEKRSPVYSTYQEVVKLFKTLYQTCSDNNILLANTLKYLTSGAVSSGKIITVNLNLNLFYWANKILEDQDWENISDIINVAVKYFKDNYKSAIKDIKRIQEEKREKKKKFEHSKEEREEEKILDMVPIRKKEDLKDIMSALEELTGEKYEISIDLEEETEDKFIVEIDGDIIEYTLEDADQFNIETSKHAIWHGKPTKAFLDWLNHQK